MADRSIRKPRGIVEDVLLQIDKFYYPVDFLILDTQLTVDMDSKIPLILGRPFLATADAVIQCRNGLMKLSFGNMTLQVNIFHVGKQPREEDECDYTYMIDTLVEEGVNMNNDSNFLEYLPRECDNEQLLFPRDISGDEQQIFSYWQPRFEELLRERKSVV